MKKRPSFEAFKKTAMQDEKFKTEYELLRPGFEIAEKIIKARKSLSFPN